LALFDLEEPEHCLKRGDEWVFAPQEPYELRGDVDNVVFPCGFTLAPDGDTLNIYYGAADTSIAVAQASVDDMLKWLSETERPGFRRRFSDH
ncbi:MAG: glycosidase, partial [Leptolinea sp.]|nr:glycosidase [Leptolinea sp.]